MKNFQVFLKSPLEERKAAYVKAREDYYNVGNSALTDAEYDALEESIRSEAPKWKYLHKTGIKTKLGKKVEVKLPVPCPSLDKLVADKPVNVQRWINATCKKYGPFFHLSAKLDGSSVEGEYTYGKLTELATRGDGVTGKSIMFLAPHLNLPKTIVTDVKKIVIRFEAAIPLAVYTKKWSGQYDSARALASAVLNRQDASAVLKDLNFVALRMLEPNPSLGNGQVLMKSLGFKVVKGSIIGYDQLTVGALPEILEQIRHISEFECDGLVISANKKDLPITEDRPDYAKAYKVNDEVNAQDTEVKTIVWKASAFGVLVPKAIIAPIQFGGVTVKQAALHNASWAVERGVGVGAKVKVLRSGDIIPKIVSVTRARPFALPDPKVYGAYEWDDTKTSLVLKNASGSKQVTAHRISRMFRTLGLDKLSIGLAEKLVAAGYTDTAKVARLTAVELSELPGVKSTAKTFADQLARIQAGDFELPELMVASGCFDKGLGETRIRSLLKAHPNCLGRPEKQQEAKRACLIESLAATAEGCGPAFAETLRKGLLPFWQWLEDSGARAKLPEKAKPVVKGSLSGQRFSWTGYRSKEEENSVNVFGGEVVPFGSKTTVLFYKPDGKASTKVTKASERGIKVATFTTFMKGVKS